VGKEAAFLDHVADAPPQRHRIHLRRGAAEDAHRSRVGVHEAVGELQGRRLAGAGRPDERDGLALADRERKAVQHRTAREEGLADVGVFEGRSQTIRIRSWRHSTTL
jgi:hypothetical protein